MAEKHCDDTEDPAAELTGNLGLRLVTGSLCVCPPRPWVTGLSDTVASACDQQQLFSASIHKEAVNLGPF